MSSIKAPRIAYSSPSRRETVEVCLSEFSTKEIERELEHRNRRPSAHRPIGEEELVIALEDVARLRTLVLCGQRNSATDMLRQILRDEADIHL